MLEEAFLAFLAFLGGAVEKERAREENDLPGKNPVVGTTLNLLTKGRSLLNIFR
jgi:hypothetical protein